ncbi:MAG: phosphoribosylformylglycinamidine cyclo-ligase [Acidiferrobacterales bacterium]|nr:phosphoribosylformylglycinamidine cyclo-ligase [Acidiferrobacterales bacterium]
MTVSDRNKITYEDAGVDIDLADRMIRSWMPQISRTSKAGQIGSPLGFGGLFEVPPGYDSPVLVSSTDGVGTKLKIAFELDKHDTVGIDLVAMCINDIIVYGAQPLYFLDYIATGQLDENVVGQVINGIVEGCEIAGAALIGGETAEMPGMYASGEYDLAGFAVGIVEKSGIVDAATIEVGDAVIGIASTGVHSNGFSLIRKLIEDRQFSLATEIEGCSLGEILLTPTRIYAKPLLKIVQTGSIRALAHITGGGLVGNIERVMPAGLCARLDSRSWPGQPIFDWIQSHSHIDDYEMMKTFNCGIGMVAVVPHEAESSIRKDLDAMQMPAYRIGVVEASNEPATRIE